MEPVREHLIESAIQEVNKGTSQKEAAARWGIPKSTLSDRLRGAKSQKESKIPAQRLSVEQERFLVDWALNEEGAGRAPNRRQFAAFAREMLLEGGDHKPLGTRWIDRFLCRNPDLKMKNSGLLESARTRGSTREAYESFYNLLRRQINEKKIIPAHIANMDEHGMQELESLGGKVIGSSLTNKAYVTSSDATTWVSVIECGTPEGRRLTPVVVFTGASLQGQHFPPGFELEDELPGWKYDYSATGWSNSTIALKWLQEVYLIETKPERPGDWRLLIIDEHSSHINTRFMWLAWKNKVQLVYLPPHTSHKTQPLDRSVFGPLKSYFRDLTKALAGYSGSAPVNKQRFLRCYRDASKLGVSVKNLESGFRKTGIWPLDPSQVLDDPEAVLDDEALPARPPTPPQQANEDDFGLFTTPQRSEDLREHQLVIRDTIDSTDRLVRTLFSKTGKSLDMKNAEIASLKAQVAHLQTELEVHRPHTRKKVKESANNTFARIEDIIEAEEQSQVVPKRRKVTKKVNQAHVVEEAEEMIVHGLDRIRRAQEE
jgi:4-hydroxybenzoate polyprenyltransferase